jgi:hypothetical protein
MLMTMTAAAAAAKHLVEKVKLTQHRREHGEKEKETGRRYLHLDDCMCVNERCDIMSLSINVDR